MSDTPRTDALMDPASPIWFKGQAMVDLCCELEREAAIYKRALDQIASWGEGPEVTGSFDEPESAKKAREALLFVQCCKKELGESWKS